MKLRLQLLLLASLVILMVAGSIAAREETKVQDSHESTDTVTAGNEKSKTQKDDTQPDSEKVHMKQKWQRYKTPSSKKTKKANSWKEKAGGKSGKEKWKAGVEEASKQKTKKSNNYGKQGLDNSKGKWVEKNKMWKQNTHRDKSSQVNEDLNVEENEFTINKQKASHKTKVKGKVATKDKWKSEKGAGVCLKNEPCSTDSKTIKDEGKKIWKSKHSDDTRHEAKSSPLTMGGVSNTDREVDNMDNSEELGQQTEGAVGTEESKHNSKQDELKAASERTAGSESKEETQSRTDDNSNKKKWKVAVSEKEENLSVEPETQSKLSKSKGLKIRRYIVEEEVLDDAEVEAATRDNMIPQLIK